MRINKPNFLYIGPDKAGSTWLFDVLSEHPECYVPACKDIYFFDKYYHFGIGWYLRFFKRASVSVPAVGEFSHDYLFSTLAADRIKNDLPGVKMMTTLRNPVERTFSHYLHWVSRGWTEHPFEMALKMYPELIEHSLYFKHLSEYFKRFDSSQIKIFLFDKLQKNPKEFISEVFHFLGVSFVGNTRIHEKSMQSSRPRSPFLIRNARRCANIIRGMGMPDLVGYIKHSSLANMLYKTYTPEERPRLDNETRHSLVKTFRTDILKLQDLISTDLSHWLDDENEFDVYSKVHIKKQLRVN